MRQNTKLKIAFFFLAFFVFLSAANFALAVRPPEVQYPPIPFSNVETPNQFIEKINNNVAGYTPEKTLPLYVKYFYSLALMLSGLIAFGAVFFGGILYTISAGNPTKMAQAREQISSGILGMVILLASYIIIVTLNPQLTIFQLPGLTKIIPPPIPPSTPVSVEGVSLFQVPTGRIIERALFDKDISGLTTLDKVKNIAQETKNLSTQLKQYTDDLNNFTESCTCGQSSCSGPSACGGAGCPSVNCNLDDRDAIIANIDSTITLLKTKQAQLDLINANLINNYAEFGSAGLLMSVPTQVLDYNSMLGYRYALEETGQKVQITSSGFPNWNDNEITFNGEKTADPASFYFDTNSNQQAIQWALTQPYLNSPFPIGEGPYPIPGGPEAPPFIPPGTPPGDLIGIAQLVGSRTGLLPSFILGLTKSESDWDPYNGVAYTRERTCVCEDSYLDWKTAVCDIIEQQIAPELNLDPFNPNQVRVSAGSPVAGCGGAMGAGQIMPFTWVGIKTRISAITGNFPPSPWNLSDGLAAAGVTLIDKYNAKYNGQSETGPLTSCSTERRLVYKYFGCNPDNLSRCSAPWYGDQVVKVSEQIATDENLEHCTP